MTPPPTGPFPLPTEESADPVTYDADGNVIPLSQRFDSTTADSPWVSSSSTGELRLSGENADIIINGKSLGRAIAKIEERLNILVPNPELEKEWAELRALGDEYRKLETKLTEQVEVWRRLKAT